MFELHELCENGDIEVVKKYISDFGTNSLNEKNDRGATSFLLACSQGHKEIVELLIKTNGFSSLNEKDNSGATPFFVACYYGEEEIVEILIKTNGFNSLNEQNNSGETPFLAVCMTPQGNEKIAELLIRTDGFDSLNEEDCYGQSPFWWACLHGHIKIIELLIKAKGFNGMNGENNKPFYTACCNDHIEIVELLLMCYDIIIPDDIIINSDEMEDLIERYKKDPETVRLNLILGDNIDLYRDIVFMCDGYFELDESSENTNGVKFMKIARQLPLELQMVLIHRMSGSLMNNITGKQFNENIAKYIDTLNESELEEQYDGQYQEFETKYGPMILIDEAHYTENNIDLEFFKKYMLYCGTSENIIISPVGCGKTNFKLIRDSFNAEL
ncbi:MAG: hypothetical protein Terrestrivirus8_22 [Terrestrivirus sp.]|uniref:Uncharacterized protein n=1 Tax=Terrestrivirus sp. TaxID=2487775 RepID=A0A3G4ZSV8_9VIRU|nr:MAG: hypothetical protein Terrestrivirus8_22 [Terrestrivirus sp.]